MGKPKRGKKGGHKGDTVPEYAVDDETLYGGATEPDPESREYMYDDIDEFHAARDKILVDEGYKEEDPYKQSDEEEVLALDSEESDDEEIQNLKAQLRRVRAQQRKDDYGSDLEDKEEDEEEDEEAGLPDSKRWGKKRGKYYGDDDIGLKNIDDEQAEAVMEEKEAIRLQKKMAAEMDDQDFGLDLFQPPQKAEDEEEDKEEKIVKDLSKLSKREKLQLLKKESPEFLTLITDFKEKIHEVQETLQPVRELLSRKKVTGKAADYVHTKFHLNMNYCTNILFYLTLKAKQIPVHNHPVIKRLLQYRNLLTQLQPLDTQMSTDLSDIVSRVRAGQEVELGEEADTTPRFVRRKRELANKVDRTKREKGSLKGLAIDSDDSDDMYDDFETQKQQLKRQKEEGRYETKDEQAALDYYQMMKDGRPQEDGEDEEEQDERMEGEESNQLYMDDEETDGKRGITYQIEKNKGLVASKKKELRNPRVKHRMKFRKAKIRRKGQIREPRKELHKYGGEISGIRAGIKRSVKLR